MTDRRRAAAQLQVTGNNYSIILDYAAEYGTAPTGRSWLPQCSESGSAQADGQGPRDGTARAREVDSGEPP
jgi:hypothetical protein